ncbi:MAG TPA: type III-A CRISPR-associated RAMP protein Csm3 [Candidatus Lachnoclostridium pullistercoris]|uniref:CRISPR system Cms endoribonuclease Csm3 n=1 Tax=Candidatus Lachnoclostridium pullistercoris TaxID=2838632 RepID=A0A9D2PA84_9FIRM|nr:type III-A CRISPR-associated RAMP protein Csm3 [Candidatus Lachnoclostridium pullistercoris]
MYGKIQITGKLQVLTGMHIGGSSAFAAIGAVDAPIIKDVATNLPMVPGSSLKGKMRTLLAREYNDKLTEPENDDVRLTRLFGTSKKGAVKRSRLLFSDMILANGDELREKGLQSLTEVKFENTINRATAVANPRQIERAIRGSVFELDLIYEVENEKELLEDMQTLGEGMKLLQYDYLGGHGSRGYGKVKFQDILAETVVGDVPEELLDECNQILGNAISERE